MSLMKTILAKSLFSVALALVLLAGCKPESKGELGEPFDKIAGISGTWELTRFIQKDLNNPIQEERDLSQFYIKEGFSPLRIQFSGADRSYTVSIETGRNYFGDGGTWSFDDDIYPSFLTLTTLIDEVETPLEFKLGSMVREFDPVLMIDLPRGCDLNTPDAVPTVVYRFEFNRINE